MSVKVGPMTMQYEGTARMQEIDEDQHSVTIGIDARESRGQGAAGATMTGALRAHGDRTEARVITDLNVTGPPAQLGRGIIEDIAETLIGQFAESLERELQRPGVHAGAGAAGGDTANGGSPADSDRAGDTDPPAAPPLDVGKVLVAIPGLRYGMIGAALLMVALLWRGAPGRRQFTVNINLRR